MSPRPPESDDAHGRRLHWVSSAPGWGMATRDLLQDSTGERFPAAFVRRQLACVAFYKYVTYCVLLVRGADGVDPDVAARTDCPVKPPELNKLHTRLERMRNAILHIGETAGPATLVTVNWRRDPDPALILETTREKGGNTTVDTITKVEIESWFDQLEPWMARQWERLVRSEGEGSNARKSADRQGGGQSTAE